jgi:hypothetical protein
MLIEETLVEDFIPSGEEVIDGHYYDAIEIYDHTVVIFIVSTAKVLRVKAYCTLCENEFVKDFHNGCDEIVPYLKALPLSLFSGECDLW